MPPPPHTPTSLTHDLAFEVWAADPDHAYVLRLRGTQVTGYFGILSLLSALNRSPAEMAMLRFRSDDEGCEEWQSIRYQDERESQFTLRTRIGPEMTVPALADTRFARTPRAQATEEDRRVVFTLLGGVGLLVSLVLLFGLAGGR